MATDIIKRIGAIGVIGCGSMGTMMSLAFAELGLDVLTWDIDSSRVDKLVGQLSAHTSLAGKLSGYHDIQDLTRSLDGRGERRLFMFSITHGQPADSVLDKIRGELRQGDVILDGGNEHYRNTERRQRELEPYGVSWIGTGVSGGYQSARRGPSMSPGGDKAAIEWVMPLLQRYAAKDQRSSRPCVEYIGPRGAGHYVKMIHNGIEGGMLSVLCESWLFLNHGLDFNYGGVADIYNAWNASGELRNTYLLEIGVDILRTTKTPESDDFVLDEVLDKVVQDDDNTEGTPAWCIMEAAARHVSAPTLAAAHFLRVASGNRAERLRVVRKAQLHGPQKLADLEDGEMWVETVRRAVYCCFLASWVQGLEILARASHDEGWDINIAQCIQIWRAGCIIRSEFIANLLQKHLSGHSSELTNLKLIKEVATELYQHLPALKEVVLQGTRTDQYLPAISATLEYLKYVAGETLPTKFMEAQLDYFGAHAYDKPHVSGEDPGKTAKGHHHYEWQPA